MPESSQSDLSKRMPITSIDAMILAYCQLVQPASADSVWRMAEKSNLAQIIDFHTLKEHINKLGRSGHLWRTADKRFVVTPSGDAVARHAFSSKNRDKIRLLSLNKDRYTS